MHPGGSSLLLACSPLCLRAPKGFCLFCLCPLDFTGRRVVPGPSVHPVNSQVTSFGAGPCRQQLLSSRGQVAGVLEDQEHPPWTSSPTGLGPTGHSDMSPGEAGVCEGCPEVGASSSEDGEHAPGQVPGGPPPGSTPGFLEQQCPLGPRSPSHTGSVPGRVRCWGDPRAPRPGFCPVPSSSQSHLAK